MTNNSPAAIGPYTIERELGRGGMGVVYLATDTRLDRPVAIKALPGELAADPDRLARFQREAKILASLNHPNVGGIHGLELLDGHPYLVLEYIEGQTLAVRLAEGTVPVEEALSLAKQIVEALEAAHEKGVVHRDLKPGNVMVTAEGVVKVLDFGLARSADGPPSSAHAAAAPDSPTVTSPARPHSPTIPGVILGTAGYMSPEQARGKPVDKRSDIFSFGCVLFELLTGAGPFSGETVTDSLGAILHREPDWTRLPAETPLRIRDLLTACLAKDRKNRLHDIGDARLELNRSIGTKEWLTVPAVAASARPTSRAAAGVAMIIAALALIGGTWWAAARRGRAPLSQPPMTSTLIASQNDDYSSARLSVISPDGKSIVFRAMNEKTHRVSLWIRPLENFKARPLPQTEIGTPGKPFWSPNSKSVAYAESGNLWAVDIEQAGARRLIGPMPGSTFGGSWGPDGTMLVVNPIGDYRVWSFPPGGGTPTPLTQIDAAGFESMHALPQFLPDGKHFLYVAIIADPALQRLSGRLYAGKLGSTEKTFVGNIYSAVWYVEPGKLVYVEDGTVKVVPFDAAALKITGDPVVVADGVMYYSGNGHSYLSVSLDGTMAYEPLLAEDQLVWLDMTGKPLETIGPRGRIDGPRIAPDGGTVAVTLRDPRTGSGDIWLLSTSRPTATRLTTDPRDERDPMWSHDSARVYFSAIRGTAFDVFSIPVDGSGVMEHADLGATGGVREWNALDASRDGKYLIARGYFEKLGLELRVVPLANPADAVPFRSTPANELEARFSPDGKWVVFTCSETTPSQVYLSSFPEHGPKVQLSETGASKPFWSPDGTTVYFQALITADSKTAASDKPTVLMAVDLATPEAFKSPPKPHVVFESPDALSFIEIAPDGKRFLTVRTPRGTPPIHVILNGIRK